MAQSYIPMVKKSDSSPFALWFESWLLEEWEISLPDFYLQVVAGDRDELQLGVW